jgi:hypothetical protein
MRMPFSNEITYTLPIPATLPPRGVNGGNGVNGGESPGHIISATFLPHGGNDIDMAVMAGMNA